MNNTQFFYVALAFLGVMANNNLLSQQLQADLQNNKVFLDDQVLELKKEISGGGTIDLIDATTERIDGICSFDKNKLQSGRAFVFNELCFLYATNAASGKEGELNYAAGTVPPELRNATVIFNVNGREILRYPFLDLTNLETSFKAADEYTALQTLRGIADDKQITIQLKFPPNVSLSSSVKHYIYLRIKGVQTTTKPS